MSKKIKVIQIKSPIEERVLRENSDFSWFSNKINREKIHNENPAILV